MANILTGPMFSYVRKVELINFAASIVALESDIDTEDTAFLGRFTQLKVAYGKLKIGANYSPSFLTDEVMAADTLNMNLYDVVALNIKAAQKRTNHPEIVAVANRAAEMLADKKNKRDCTNQKARQGLTAAIVEDIKRFSKADIKLLGLTEVLEELDAAQQTLLNALTTRTEYKAGKERQVFQQACNDFLTAYSNFKSYVNNEVTFSNNIEIFGKLFVRKLEVIVSEMNRLSAARKNNELAAATES
ncbi:MAG: hypothetical protein IKS00_06910 [Bacteroidales bacterium]|nr:hypothetical protein [Bacteroidales bacterium]